MLEQTIKVDLEVIDCPGCGTPFAAFDGLIDRRRKDGRSMYCPNGHSMSWPDTEIQQLRRRLKATEQDLANIRDNLRVEAASRVQAQRELRKVKVRVSGGVCPYCKRSFIALQRHVHTKHPTEAHG